MLFHLPCNAPYSVIASNDDLKKLVRRLNNGAAPGPSGWTMQMLMPYLRKPEILRAVATLLTDIANGKIAGRACEALLASRLIAIPKAGDRLRPIAMEHQEE